MEPEPQSQVVLRAENTPLGWIGVAFVDDTISRIHIGLRAKRDAESTFGQPVSRQGIVTKAQAKTMSLLSRFLHGEPVSLASLSIDDAGMTPFQSRVSQLCREIPWGETVTYGQLATLAESPGASRAVGSVMARNRFPLVIPCHRVVAAGGGMGGFSAPTGIEMKKQLLANESRQPRTSARKRRPSALAH